MNNSRSILLLYLTLTILLLYSNTFHSPWVLDDPPNITENYPIHITDLMPETLWRTFFAKPFETGQLHRPLSNLTFALNWYCGQNNPLGYHIFNIFVHILTGTILIRTILALLKAPHVKSLCDRDIFFIAVLSATLWAINPIQTQAVTYIVQRMASMTTMFFLVAIYNYIRARQSITLTQRNIHIILCIFCFILALSCKENAVTLIPSLLLIEIVFFYQKNEFYSKIFISVLITANIFFAISALYYAIDHGYLQHLFSPIGTRPFSIGERLLTEPGIVLFYLSLILYPNPARLSIDHSFSLSSSLFQPWTTFPAILTVGSLLIFSIVRYRKNPLLSFAILFFLINHLIESTIIPLELIFEHRNYLPSLFLYLPIAVGIRFAINNYYHKNKALYFTIIVATTLLLTITGLGTYNRNAVWATEESLWSDALQKAPDNARPFAKLGEIYGWQKEKTAKNLQIAVALLQKALERESPRVTFKPALVDNIGKIYSNFGFYDQAVQYYTESLRLNPHFLSSRFDLANALTLQGKFDQALKQINIVISQNYTESNFHNLKTLLCLWLSRPQEAVLSSQLALKHAYINKDKYFYNTGVALSRAGYYDQGSWFLRRALLQNPDDFRILCSLIENNIVSGNTDAALKYASQLIDSYPISYLADAIKKLSTDFVAVPIDVDIIVPSIIEAGKRSSIQLDNVPM